MRSSLFRLFVAALTGISTSMVAVALAAAPASAGHSWSGYHWSASSYPIDLRPINSLGPNFRSQGVATDVNSDWNQSRKFANDQRFGNNDSATRRNCPYPSGKSFRMCNYNWGATGWAGLAQIHISGNHILDGRARVNDYYGTSYSYRRHVLCQEYGHVLGLDHQASGNNSCMDDSSLGWDELSPNGHDYDMLLNIYDHTHGGQVAHESSSAAHTDASHTVVRLPNGDLLITFILWAPAH